MRARRWTAVIAFSEPMAYLNGRVNGGGWGINAGECVTWVRSERRGVVRDQKVEGWDAGAWPPVVGVLSLALPVSAARPPLPPGTCTRSASTFWDQLGSAIHRGTNSPNPRPALVTG